MRVAYERPGADRQMRRAHQMPLSPEQRRGPRAGRKCAIHGVGEAVAQSKVHARDADVRRVSWCWCLAPQAAELQFEVERVVRQRERYLE